MQSTTLRIRAVGDTRAIVFRFTEVDGSILDLTDCSLQLSVNVDENPADPAATNLFTLDGTIDVATGYATFPLEQAQADAFEPRVGNLAYWYDVVLTDASGATDTVIKGRLPVTGSITP